jgi:hypothetical protein
VEGTPAISTDDNDSEKAQAQTADQLSKDMEPVEHV